MRTKRRPPKRYGLMRDRRRARGTGHRRPFLAVIAVALLCLGVLATQLLYVPPEAQTYRAPSQEEADAAEARLVSAFRIVERHQMPAHAPPAGRSLAKPALGRTSRQVRLTETDVNAWAASEAPRYADKARNVRVGFGDGTGRISGVVERSGIRVYVTAKGRLVRSPDGALQVVVDSVSVGRVPLGPVADRWAQRWIDEELEEHGFVGIIVDGVTMHAGEVVITAHPPRT